MKRPRRTARAKPRGSARCRASAWGLAVLLVLALGGAVQARIYMRLGRRDDARLQLEILGAERLLQRRMEINGVPADLWLAGIDGTPEALLPRIARNRSRSFPSLSADGGAMVTWRHDGRTSTLLLFPAGERRTLCILIRRDAEPDPGPPRPPERDWPRTPRETLRFSARNRDSGTAFSIGDTPLPPETVRTLLDEQLRAHGWVPVMIPAGNAGMHLYARDGRACAVWVAAASGGHGSRIAILRQPTVSF